MSQIDKLKRFTAKLRTTGVQEIGSRIHLQRIKARWYEKGAPQPAKWPEISEIMRVSQLPFYGLPTGALPLTNVVKDVPAHEIQALLDEADAYLENRWFFFSFAEQGSPAHQGLTDWYRCSRTGLRSNANVFGPNYDYGDSTVVGNVKYIWEKNRHHHTTVLALAYALTGHDKYAQAAWERIEDWISKNPSPKGINWVSALEVGERITAWAWIFHLLRSHENWHNWFANSTFLISVYHHQAFLIDFESQGMLANNQLLGEMAALYVSALTWPIFTESAHWQQHAKAVLEREMVSQVFPSGIHRELAFEYQLFSTELFLLPAVLGAQRGDAFSDSYLESLRNTVQTVAALRDAQGNWPRYGETDESLAVQLEARRFDRLHRLIEIGRCWLGASVSQFETVPFEARGGHLFACIVIPVELRCVSQVKTVLDASFAFEDAGLYSLVSNRGSITLGSEEILMLADVGALGYLNADHGHTDALSFTLSVAGQAVLVDPGTFAQDAEPAWRQYFQSTRAHNTLELDASEQSTRQGVFPWLHMANTSVQSWNVSPKGGKLIASHDGYTRLLNKPTHVRTFELNERTVQITDQIMTAKADMTLREVALYWHFHPDCEVTAESDAWIVRWDGGQARIGFDERLTLTAHKAELEPKNGWYSPRFDVKVPSWTLRAVIKAVLPLELITVIEIL